MMLFCASFLSGGTASGTSAFLFEALAVQMRKYRRYFSASIAIALILPFLNLGDDSFRP